MGFQTGPTFFPAHGKARRLDVALATKAAAAACASINAFHDTGCPGHSPLALELDLPVFSEKVPRIRKPAGLPESIPQQRDLAESILHRTALPDESDVNSIYQYFSQVAEEYLISAAGLSSKRYIGCGRIPKLVFEHRFSPQGPKGSGCENVALRRLKRLLRRLEHLQHYFSNNMASSYKSIRLWQCIASNQKILLTCSDLFTSDDFPSASMLASMIIDIQKSVTKMQNQEAQERVNIARKKFQQDWKTKPSNVYSKVDPVIHSPAVILQKPDGNLTGNFSDLESLLLNAWLPIFDKYSKQPEPSFRSTFQTQYP